VALRGFRKIRSFAAQVLFVGKLQLSDNMFKTFTKSISEETVSCPQFMLLFIEML